jgi:beta-lactam-binding protein with PASTA domain
MRNHVAAGFVAVSVLSVLSVLSVGTLRVGLGTGIASAEEPGGWEVPSFEGMTLSGATEIWTLTTGGAGPELKTRVVNTAPGYPMNPETWEVCGQKPGPGESVTASSSVAVAVAPPNMC